MTIAAPVFQHDAVTLEHLRNLGVFEFEQLPAPDDRFNFTQANGRVGRYRVLYVAHEPYRAGEPRGDPDRFSALVHVVFIDEFW